MDDLLNQMNEYCMGIARTKAPKPCKTCKELTYILTTGLGVFTKILSDNLNPACDDRGFLCYPDKCGKSKILQDLEYNEEKINVGIEKACRDKPLIKNIGDNFITACLCCLNLATGELIFASAGHSPIAVIRDNGDVELHQVQGRMIQVLFKPNYIEKRIFLKKNDSLILYTDGITEAENKENVVLGADDDAKFSSWIKNSVSPKDSPEEVCQNIYNGGPIQ